MSLVPNESLKYRSDYPGRKDNEVLGIPQVLRKQCDWIEDVDGVWQTACDNLFEINEGTPEQNNMKFCCYCGKPIDQFTVDPTDT